jgi:hypothetical protein
MKNGQHNCTCSMRWVCSWFIRASFLTRDSRNARRPASLRSLTLGIEGSALGVLCLLPLQAALEVVPLRFPLWVELPHFMI